MPRYIVNGKTYNIPEDKVEGFEKRNPDAAVRYFNEGRIFNIPLFKRGGFVEKFPQATTSMQRKAEQPAALAQMKQAQVDMPIAQAEHPQVDMPIKDIDVDAPHYTAPKESTNIQLPIMAQQPDDAEPMKHIEHESMGATRDQVASLRQGIGDALLKRNRELDALQGESEEKLPFLARLTNNMNRGGMGGAPLYVKSNNGRLTDGEYMSLQAASRSVTNAQRIIDEADYNARRGTFAEWMASSFAGGATRGLGQKLFDAHTWDMGVNDIAENNALLAALEAYDKGGKLSEGQQMLLDAKAVELATNAYFGSYVGRGYKAGSVTGESIPFMLEMMINPASSIGGGAASKLTRYVLMRFGKEAVKKSTGKLMAGKIAARVGADVAGAAAMSATTGSGRVLANTLERMAGEINTDRDDSGETVFAGHEGGEDFGAALRKAYTSTTIENYSEMLGEYFSPLTGAMSRGVSKGLNKVGLQKVNDFVDAVSMNDIGRMVGDFEKHAQWNGVFGEYAEEVAGGIMNALLVGDQTLDGAKETGVFNLDNNIDTFLGVSLLGGFMSSAKTMGYRTPKYRAKKEMRQAGARAEGLFPDSEAWNAIRATIDEGTDEEIRTKLVEVAIDENFNEEQISAAFEYARRSMAYRGFERGEQQRHIEGSGSVQVDMEQSFDNGYTLETAQEMNDAKNMLEYQRERVTLNLSEQDLQLIDNTGPKILDVDNSGVWSDEQVGIVRDYLNAKQVYDGMIQRVRDDIDGRIDRSNAMVDGRTHRTTGMVQGATMKVDDRRVYVVSGNLVQYADGSGIDNEKSDESIIVRDAQTGELEQVSPTAVLNMDEPLNPEDEKRVAAEQIREQFAREAADKIEGIVVFNPGDVHTIEGENGEQMQVRVVANKHGVIDNGDGTVNVSDGVNVFPIAKQVIQEQADAAGRARVQEFERTRKVGNKKHENEEEKARFAYNDVLTLRGENGEAVRGSITGEVNDDGRYEVFTEEPINGRRVNKFTRKELEGLLLEHNGQAVANENGATQGEEAQVVDNGVENLADVPGNQSESTAAEEQKSGESLPHNSDHVSETVSESGENLSAMGRIPKDEQGNPVYEQAETPDLAWDAVVEQTEGDEEMAQRVADAMVSDKEAALKKMENAKPKGGASIGEKIAAEKERKAAIDAAKRELEAWRRIAGTANRRKMEAETERRRMAEEAAAIRKAEEERLRAEREEAERIEREALNGVNDVVDDIPYESIGDVTAEEQVEGREQFVDSSEQTEEDKGRSNDKSESLQAEDNESKAIGLSEKEAITLIAQMEEHAEVAPEIELTIENWDALFGEDGMVSTPIGDVKMGENQFTKLMRQDRNSKLGMVKPTLEHPHVIIEDASEAKEGDTTERASSYVFIRSFRKTDGSRYYYFTSVTVSKDGKEVVVSNQEKRRNAIANLLTKGKLVWKHADNVSDASDLAQGLYSSQGNLSDLATEGTDAPQTNDVKKETAEPIDGDAQTEQRPADVSVTASPDVMQGNSTNKGNDLSRNSSELGEKNAEAEAKIDQNSTETQAENDVFLSQKEFMEKGMLAALEETEYKTLEEWKEKNEEERAARFDALLDGYVDYVKDFAKDEKLQALYDRSSVREQKKIREGIVDAELDYHELLDTSPKRLLMQNRLERKTKYAKGRFYDGTIVAGEVLSQTPTGLVIGYRGGKYNISANHVLEQSDEPIENVRFREVGYSAEEQEIISRAKRDGTYMKAPNGEPTNLTEKQWVQVRTKAFKEWFGDWEKMARIEKLRKAAGVEITGKEIEPSNDLKQYKKNALEYGKTLRGEYTNKDTGKNVLLSSGNKNGGIKEVLQHDFKDVEHLQSIAAIPQIIEDSIYIDSVENSDKVKNPNVSLYHYYVCGLKIGGVDYTVRAVFAEQSNGERYYDHKLTNIEKGKLINELAQISFSSQSGLSSTGESGETKQSRPAADEEEIQRSPISDVKDKRLLSILQTNSSKVVDENGEPMVVYHGTLANGLRRFNKDFIGSRYSYDEKGFFFISSENIAKDYATSEFDANRRGEVIDAYLNLKKPLFVDSAWCRKNGLGSRVFEDNDVIEFWDNYQSLLIEESEKNDGIVVTDGKTTMVVAFEPNQIKSATENNGDFSSDNDDIRFRVSDNEIASFAQKHNLKESDVREYAQSMSVGHLGGAAYAFKSMKRDVRYSNPNLSLLEFTKTFSPIKNDLYERFGNIDALRDEYVQREMMARSVMEAARKREEEAAAAERKRLEEFELMTDKEMDASYFNALEENDESRMRDIINEAARRKGYVSDGEFRMSHRAPSYDEEGYDKSLIDIANNKDSIRESLSEQLRMNRDEYKEESAIAINAALSAIDKGEKATVTVYRAVPKFLKESKVRNGDWVSLSESYVKSHGENALNGDYKIMKEDVPVENVYWDGNDVNEWGYDDQSDYRYKNAKNNRKLNDLITRDDKGGIIPPSERFNSRKADERYRSANENNVSNLGKDGENAKQKQIISIIEDLSEKLHTPVRIARSLDDVRDGVARDAIEKGMKVAGWFSPEADEVVVYLPNATDVEDVKRTVLHEVVGHKGLLDLFGEDKYDEIMMDLYKHLPEDVQKSVMDEAVYKYEYSVPIAMDEYLAEQAESDETPSWWNRVVSAIREALRSMGIDVELTDNDVKYLLWKSRRRLEKANTEESNTNGYYGDDVMYRSNKGVDAINEQFNEQLAQQIDGVLPKGHVYQLGMPSEVLLGAGLPNLPIELAASRLSDKAMQDNHPFELSEIKDLPNAIQNPLAAFRSATHIGSFVVMTEIEHNGKNFVVAIEANKKAGRIEVNSVRSVHYRNSNSHIANWITEGLLEYVDKERMLVWLSKQRYNSADVRKLYKHATNIVNNFENQVIGDEINRTQTEKHTPTRAEQKAMGAHVQELAKKLRLENVEVVTDRNGLEGKKRGAKGFYTKSSGKITIVVPNNMSVADVEQTLLHEAVAHYGLRQLFGAQFDAFLDNVFDHADGAVRKRIVDMATENNWDFRTATEEHLAGLAERTNFEEAQKPGWWQRIKSFFSEMLRELGFGGFNERLADNELRYILWRSYENLREGKHSSLFAESADIAKQYELGVGEYGDRVPENDALFRDGDPEIHERKLARERYERRVQRGMYQAQEALQDSMLSVKEAMDAVLGNGTYIENVDGFENAYLAENRLSGTNKEEADAFARLVFKPLLSEVAKLAPTEAAREELTDYMMAKHGLERNRKMAEDAFAAYQKQQPNGQKTLDDFRQRDYAGLTALTGFDDVAQAEAEAGQMVADYESGHDTTNLWDRVNAVSRAILSKSYECGMMSKETFDKVSDMYEFYIPLRGFDEKTSGEAYAYLLHKGSAFNAPIRKAGGRSSKADDPFANLQSMAESAIMQGNRNKLVKQRFLNFVLNHPSDLFSVSELWVGYDAVTDEWKPVFPDNIKSTDSAEEVEKKMQDFESKMNALAQQHPDQYKRGKDAENIPYRVVEDGNLQQHQVVVKRGGRDYVITVNGNPRVAQALNGHTNPDSDISGAIGAAFRAGEWVNRQLSAVYTTRNPDFIVSNFMRDMLYANSMVWVKESPNYALRFHRNVAMANPAMMKSLLAKHRKGELDMNDGVEKMFHQFMMNGGETGYSGVRDMEKHKKDVSRKLKKLSGEMPIREALDLLGEQFDELNRAVENCARFAAFVTSREMGRTVDRAIYDAKEISVNFNKKGSGAKFFGKPGQTLVGDSAAFVSGFGRAGFVFWNAAIQGTTNFGRPWGTRFFSSR